MFCWEILDPDIHADHQDIIAYKEHPLMGIALPVVMTVNRWQGGLPQHDNVPCHSLYPSNTWLYIITKANICLQVTVFSFFFVALSPQYFVISTFWLFRR